MRAEYKNREKGFDVEEYGKDVKTKKDHKETSASLRCGNIGKSINKGFRDTSCSFCKKDEENLVHIFECKSFRESMKDEMVAKMD